MKCDTYDFNVLKESIERFALYDDLKDLNQRVLPPIDMFQSQLQEFRNEHV